MAIQDDNTILNKGDLKAYHEAIAPLLGGTFMVRTNNSDFYSTDEKVVGVWADGKPVYQKTIAITIGSGTQSVVYSFPEANIENLIDYSGYIFWTSAEILPIPWYSDADWNISAKIAGNQNIVIATHNYNGKSGYITVQYTKTTDTAGSATTTPGAYDINFPNTWPENTEIYFGNGLYGYRWFNGSVTFSNYWYTSSSTDNGIKAGNNIISYGGNVRPANTTGSSAISAFYVNNNNTLAFKWDWTASSVLAEVNAWYTYTK